MLVQFHSSFHSISTYANSTTLLSAAGILTVAHMQLVVHRETQSAKLAWVVKRFVWGFRLSVMLIYLWDSKHTHTNDTLSHFSKLIAMTSASQRLSRVCVTAGRAASFSKGITLVTQQCAA